MSGSARSRLVTHLTRAVGAAGVVTVLGVAPALIGPGPAAASALRTSRVSVTATGAQSSGSSIGSALSGDGRFAGFTSSAPDLVPDPSTWSEALVRDRRRGTTTVVSVSSTGAPGDFWDGSPAISVTGRYVAFDADSTNLVPGDGNGLRDVFVRDTGARTTERVSVSSSGAESVTGESMAASISADGRFVVFSSSATDLVPGAPPAGTYRHDRTTGVTTAVAENASGQPVASGAGSISPSGRYVAFESPAADILTGDTNGTGDVFVRDYVTGTTVRATVAGDGTQLSAGGYGVGTTSVSDTGVVAFVSTDSALAPGGVSQVYVRDLRAGTTRLVSRSAAGTPGDVYSTDPAVSRDGRYVVFSAEAGNLVPADANGHESDVFLSDLRTGRLILVSRSSRGEQGDAASVNPSISADGRHVAYNSYATNLVPRDTNGVADTFVTDLSWW
jgi:TolB protein